MELLLSGASRWYTASEVRLGCSECPKGREKKWHGRRRGAVRVEKRLSSVQQISADIRIEYTSWGRLRWKRDSSKASVAGGGTSAGVVVPCMGRPAIPRAWRGHGGRWGDTRKQRAAVGLDGLVLRCVESKSRSTAEHSTAQHSTAESGCKSSRAAISKGLGRAN
jgi:hypothetical protein